MKPMKLWEFKFLLKISFKLSVFSNLQVDMRKQNSKAEVSDLCIRLRYESLKQEVVIVVQESYLKFVMLSNCIVNKEVANNQTETHQHSKIWELPHNDGQNRNN